MSRSTSSADALRERRELRAEISRRRRRINADLSGVTREAKQLVSWRTHAARHPIATLGGAFGIGLALSAGLPRGGWVQRLLGLAARQALSGVPSMLANGLAEALIAAARRRSS